MNQQYKEHCAFCLLVSTLNKSELELSKYSIKSHLAVKHNWIDEQEFLECWK